MHFTILKYYIFYSYIRFIYMVYTLIFSKFMGWQSTSGKHHSGTVFSCGRHDAQPSLATFRAAKQQKTAH